MNNLSERGIYWCSLLIALPSMVSLLDAINSLSIIVLMVDVTNAVNSLEDGWNIRNEHYSPEMITFDNMNKNNRFWYLLLAIKLDYYNDNINETIL